MISRLVLAAGAVVALAAPVQALDWPQWLGPNRDGTTTDAGLLKQWPAGGPKLKWKNAELGGDAYSTPVVARRRVFLLAALDNHEYVVALDEQDGSRLWATKIGKIGGNKGVQHPGPRGSVTVDRDSLYALGSAGDLVCLELASGNLVWTKSLPGDFGGKPGGWAYAESPLVDGKAVVACPGGKTATVVALDKKDGTPLWKAALPTGDDAAYSSPIRADIGGVPQYICYLSKGLVGLKAADGDLLWRIDNISSVTNVVTPMFHRGQVFCTTHIKGGGLVTLTADNNKFTATQAWFSAELASQIGGFLRVGDHLYGTASKGGSQLMCVEFATGKVVWKNACVGTASLCVADGLLYVRGHGGAVALVEPTPKGFTELGRFNQPDRSKKPAWPYPIVANGCLYLRDCGTLLCYDVRDPAAGK
jgi:outer membrane protein assembly factor BamB